MTGTFTIYFLGGEQAGWRRLLADNGVDHLGVSFAGLVRRLPKRKAVKVSDWGFGHVFLDSGGYSANKHPEQHTKSEWEAYAEAYRGFIESNVDDLELVSEFDCMALGTGWIEQQRRFFYDHLDREQFLPIWHPEQGLAALEELGSRYPRIGIAESAFDQQLNVAPRLNALARGGRWLHGVAITKPDVLRQVEFSSAASTSWLSPMRFGDTLIWDGNRLVRYPARMKEQARRRHQTLFEREGFDAARIQADDKTEITRLSIWSWRQLEASITQFRSNYAGVEPDAENPSTDDGAVAAIDPDDRNGIATPQTVIERDTVPLPVLGSRKVQTFDKETNSTVDVDVVAIRSRSNRVCNSCHIRAQCPMSKPNHRCAFDIPLQVRTPEQRRALMEGLIEMQGQRLAFARFVEEVNGGYPDPNVSQEYDRLVKAFQAQAELEDNRDFLRIQVEARGRTGALSRLFGGDAASALQEPFRQSLDRDETDGVVARVIEGEHVLEPARNRRP